MSNYKVNEVVMIGYRNYKNGQETEFRYKIPVIITKVNDKDVNGHNTYNYLIPVQNCEFISFVEDKNRYLWRWTIDEEEIPAWFIDDINMKDNREMLSEYGVDVEQLFYKHQEPK